jgi:ABC-type Fe3+ transport system substrate-binding protein
VPDKFYVDPSGTFTVNYPVGWIVQSLADTPDEQKKSQPILFASDPAVFDMISDNKAGINARGVVVYVGNSKDLMDQLGARNVSQPVDPLNAKTLLATIIANQSSDNGRFGALIQGRAIRDYATAEAPFSVSSQESKPVADGAILMMQLGADKFAVFVGVAPPGDGKSISALARAMAETLQAPPKVMVN